MEDPSEEEREIQEYSEEEESKTNTSSMVSWILDKSLNVGRKIVITGIVISSAPLILPPLLVVSALGFALAVPFGFVYASYACTQKLMNKLLPYPTSSSPHLMLENGTVLFEDEKKEPMKEVEESVKVVGYEEDFGDYLGAAKSDDYGNQNTEKNEEEPMNSNVIVNEEVKETEKSEEEPMNSNIIVDEKVKEKGYEEDVAVGEYVEGEDHDEGPLDLEGKIDVKIEGMGEQEEEEPVIERSEGLLPEQPLDEDKVNQVVSVEKDGKNAGVESDLVVEGRGDEIAKEIDEKNFTTNVDVEEMEKSFEDASMKSEMQGAEDEKKQEGSKENKEIIQERRNNDYVEMGGMIQGNKDEKNVGNVVLVEKNGSINGKTLGEVEIIEENRDVANNKAQMQSGGTKNQIDSVVQEEPKGSAEFLELDVSVEVHEIKDAGIDSERDTPMPASKVLLSEEKIWEHIDALRTIVGYKAAPLATCTEELKALYIFTGVEPPEPASYKNQTNDLEEVNDKLQFLMSIVGVK